MQTKENLIKNIPTTLVLLGATGDLFARKIVPSLFHLFKKGELPNMFRVIGFARRPLSQDDFRVRVKDALISARVDISDTQILENFSNLFLYVQGEFTDHNSYKNLQKTLHTYDESWGVCANKLFYLAVPPSLYETIFRSLAREGLTLPCSDQEGWTRVIVEKPFGNDAKTAKALDELLGQLFEENQIYRIDHYLAKEMIQNILAFRFSNNLFEEVWNHSSVERIHVRLFEQAGVDERGAFYDKVGALRDVGQNHLLQMLALATMDHPENFTATTVRAKRADILKSLMPLSRQDVRTKTFRAQYKGYHDSPSVALDSTTETYFKVYTELLSARWRGVKVILEGGKKMKESQKEIRLTFTHPSPCLCFPGTAKHHKNEIIIRMEPKEQIEIKFWAKKPGLIMETEPRVFHFHLRGDDDDSHATEYEKLLLDCIRGDQTLFVSTEEVRFMWRFIDPIISAWRDNVAPLHVYEPESGDIEDQSSVIGEQEHTENNIVSMHTIGVVGLGKMGGNLVRRLLDKGWSVSGFNRSHEPIQTLAKEGMNPAYSLKELVAFLPSPRIVWLMLPSGTLVDAMLFGKDGLAKLLRKGDIVIDGGNSFYKDTVRRAKRLSRLGISYLDSGTSGGPGGARYGASLMIGGDAKVFHKIEHLFRDLAVPDGYQHLGPSGAGHFVKMVHNGIEYGMMQALAEGFAVMRKSKFKPNLLRVADIYNHGSVIESRLVGWLLDGFRLYGEDLKKISGTVAHTGEGAWTVEAAKELGVDAKIIEESLLFRVRSEKNPSYTGQVLSVLRNQFGGHAALVQNGEKAEKKKSSRTRRMSKRVRQTKKTKQKRARVSSKK